MYGLIGRAYGKGNMYEESGGMCRGMGKVCGGKRTVYEETGGMCKGVRRLDEGKGDG